MCSRPVPGAAGAGLLLPVAGGGAAPSLRVGGPLRGPGEGPQVPLRLVPPLLRDGVRQPATVTLEHLLLRVNTTSSLSRHGTSLQSFHKNILNIPPYFM